MRQINFDRDANNSGIFIGGKQITAESESSRTASTANAASNDNRPDYSNGNLSALYHGSWPIHRGKSTHFLSVWSIHIHMYWSRRFVLTALGSVIITCSYPLV